MAQSVKFQPSFEDVLNILSQIPQDKLLGLKYKLRHLISGRSSTLLQAMVLLTLGQEADARICLNALGDERAALYIHQTKLGPAGLQQDGENLQPPQLDAGALALLAQIYSLLAKEELCSHEAVVKADQAATEARNASRDAQGDSLNRVLAGEQEKCGSAIGTGGSDNKFQTLRSDVSTGFLQKTIPNSMVKSSPVRIRAASDLSGPRTLHSSVSSASLTNLQISESPTAVFCMQPPSREPSRLCDKDSSSAQQPAGDRQSHSLQETGWASSSNTHPRLDTNAQVPQAEKALQVSSCHPSLPIPETQLPTLGAVSQPVETSDISSIVTAEPPTPKESRDQKQELSTGLPDPRTTVDVGPACAPTKDSYVPVGTSSSAPASTSSCFPPHTYSSSTLSPPLYATPYSLPHPSPFHSPPSPACPPPFQTVKAASASEPDSGERKFFTFVILHAGEDEHVACRVKNLLENMGVPNGATFCEEFLIAGHGRLTCFQDALENSAFIILLLTKNFLCHLCMFETNSALMESIQRPSKHNSVIPFVPKENPLERSEIPSILSVLVALDENSPGFARVVKNTFTPSKINERKAMWYQIQQVREQKRRQQLYKDHNQTLQNLGALNLGFLPQVPLSETPCSGQLLEQLMPHQSSQQCRPPWASYCPPAATHPPPPAAHPASAQLGPSPSQPFHLPSGYHNVMPDPGGAQPIIIQHARMVQIGNHNTMQVETAAPGPQDSEKDSTENS
ncbi:TIR domain-containing adapter molecule 1 [Cygnus atratus]|uniref:TIR domain-containing adapter molecule 1 n=1 Tax=Cygnus atratus TaxID=8868 RepID=UPI0015D58EC3|nr:TIR domain-containing adapter molecule 1 [Cygnus atratus]XP_035423592.1 TIR domain-containing adapter molecule 1 [Cygnus atratus]